MGVWTESARDYDSFERKWHFYSTVAEELLRNLEITPSSRVLELASGTGACTTILAARCPGGRVVGLDNSEGMLGLARENVEREGFTNVSLLISDAENLSPALRGQNFDVAVCNSAFWHFRDPSLVLRGLRSLLVGPRQFGLSLPSWRNGSPQRWEAHREKARELLLKYGVDAETVERRFAESATRRTDPAELLESSGFQVTKDAPFELDFPKEARDQWRSIPAFSKLPSWRGPLFADLDPSIAAKVKEEMREWRRGVAPHLEGRSRWRILIASVRGVPG